MTRYAAAAALLALAACSSGGGPARPTPTPSKTTAKPKPSRTPTATPSRTPTPTATTPPPVTGTPVGATGALLAYVQPAPGRKVSNIADCATAFPDLEDAHCGALKLDGGSLLWGTGSSEGSFVVQLLTQDAGGSYVLRYEGRDDARAWTDVRVSAAPLAGHGIDGVAMDVRLDNGALTYDVLTWFAGGPLVLRAHRPPLADGRLAVHQGGGLDEYARGGDGTYARRLLAWDGRQFRISAGTRVAESSLPPG